MHLFPSQRGGQKLSHNGYIYVKERVYDTYTTWRCERSRWPEDKCGGRVNLINGEVRVTQNHHSSHMPNPAYVEAEVAKANLYAAGAQSQTFSRNLVTATIQTMSASAIAKLPSMQNMATAIRSKRNRIQAPRPNPTTLAELELPEDTVRTLREENFLLYDSGSDDENRIILFGTAKNLEVLGNCSIWSANGTFETCPSLFNQLWVVHGYYRSVFLPLVYALMPKRTTDCYERVLKVLVERNVKSPQTLIQDFELAELNSFRNVFPNISINGCWFHYAQCLYRKVQELGKSSEYASNQEFHDAIKLFMALPFAKLTDIVTYYDAVVAKVNGLLPLEFEDDFLSYMEATWIGVLNGARRRLPRFRHEYWNLYVSVANNEPRINNAAEGWHNAFSSSIGSTHPTIFKFIEAIKNEQGRTEAQIIKLDAGEKQPKSQKYSAVNEHIFNVVDDYESYSPFEFLKAISHNFNL